MAVSSCCCRKIFARPGAALRSTPGISSFIVPNGVYTLNVWVVGGGNGFILFSW